MLAGMPCPCSGFVSKISYVMCATVWGLWWCNFFWGGSKFTLQMYVWGNFEFSVCNIVFFWMSEEGHQLMDDLVDEEGNIT